MREIADIVADIEEESKFASRHVDEFPSSTRPGWAARIAGAKARLKDLDKEHGEAVRGASLAIFVTGNTDATAKFAALAEAEGDTLTLDARELYNRVGDVVEQSMGPHRTFSASQFPAFARALREIAGDLGVHAIESPKIPHNQYLADRAATRAFVRGLIREGAGDELNRLYLGVSLAREAAARRYKGKVVPAVVLGADPEEVSGLAGAFARVGATVSLADGEEPTRDDVLAAFEKSTKKKTKKNQEAKHE